MGMGSPEPNANREHTQVENLCYERPRASWTPPVHAWAVSPARGV